MHNELIEQIKQLTKQLLDQEIYVGGKGFYQLLEEVPSGSKNNRFFCLSLADNKRYVIEFAPGNLAHIELQKYLRRALFLMVLQHDKGIISAKDFSMDPARSFVVLDWVDGKDLHALLKYTTFTLNEALWILLDLTEALAHLADFSFIHRNINPSNIILQNETGRAYLAGVEYVTQSDFLQTRLDINTQYVSPEMMQSLLAPEKPVFLTPWTDIYSLGSMFFHMLTGETPFPKRPDMEKWVRKASSPTLNHPSLQRKDRKYCQGLLDKTMARDFYKRWSAPQLHEYIQNYLGTSERAKDMARWLKSPLSNGG